MAWTEIPSADTRRLRVVSSESYHPAHVTGPCNGRLTFGTKE